MFIIVSCLNLLKLRQVYNNKAPLSRSAIIITGGTVTYNATGSWTTINKSDISGLSIPSGYTAVMYWPYSENQGAMWYQLRFQCMSGGFTIKSDYNWSNLKLYVAALCVKS